MRVGLHNEFWTNLYKALGCASEAEKADPILSPERPQEASVRLRMDGLGLRA